MRVVFVNQPITPEERYGQLATAGGYSPPMALCLLAAVARRSGHDVSIIDSQALSLDHEKTVSLLEERRPDVIAMSAYTPTFPSAKKLAGMLKERLGESAKIIMGGPHITALPEESIRECPEMDFAVIGEGEDTLLDLLDHLDQRQDTTTLHGIAFKGNDGATINPPRAFIEDLDKLPLPAWDMLKEFPSAYKTHLSSLSAGPCTSVIASRGCPKRCLFCDRSVFGSRVRAHSHDYMVEMIEYLHVSFGIQCFVFEDDNFVALKRRLVSFCELLLKKNLSVVWSCQASADLIDREILPLMKRAGCRMIHFGIESGSQKILDIMRKKIHVEQVENVIRETRRIGILTRALLIAGFFGETRETMEETLAFLRRCRFDDISWHYFTPFPGSDAWDKVRDYGTFNPVWDKMNLYNPVFVPHGLTAGELSAFVAKSYRQFYLRPSTIASYLKRIKNPQQFLSIYKSALSLMRYIFSGKQS